VSEDRPRVGISACLLGEPVRYDAGHKLAPFLVETLGQHVEWVPVCPEVEAGFGTPREPMSLVVTDLHEGRRGEELTTSTIALVLNRQGTDVTARLASYARKRVESLAHEGLSGFILKKDSPSCGIEGVKVYAPDGSFEPRGRGLFAEALLARMPDLPVEDEAALADPQVRESFLERVFAYRG
jgi:uncharacterized protein YbbK (DUF523 family)